MRFRIKNFLGPFPKLDWKISLLTIVSTTLLLVDYYYPLTASNSVDRIILYLLIPLLFTWFVFRESPAEYGFQWGDWKAGLAITLAAVLVLTPLIWSLGSANGALRSYYEPVLSDALPLPLYGVLELFGWEFFFRGWLLFGYARKFGPDALWIQAVPFALAHAGKPALETFSTIFGGFAFGLIAWRTRSFLYPFLIHWYIFVLLVVAGTGFTV